VFRFARRSSTATLIVLLAARAVLLTPVRRADAAGCSVSNVGTAAIFGVLQGAVDVATEGDTLRIKGTCVGTTMIRFTSLHLRGVPTAAQPTPTLDGGGLGRALRLSEARVVILDLTITHGKAKYGGGIRLSYSRLSLKGDTTIAGNTAGMEGGEIYLSTDCLLALEDSVTVTGNTAGTVGGGVRNTTGTVSVCSDLVAISPNDPDDPPATLTCT